MWHCLWVIPLCNKYSDVSKYQKTKHSKEITQDLIMTNLFQILFFTYMYISLTMTSFQRQSYMELSNTSLPTHKLKYAHVFLFQHLFVWVYVHGVFVSWLEESTSFRDTGWNKVKEQWLPLSMFPVTFQSLVENSVKTTKWNSSFLERSWKTEPKECPESQHRTREMDILSSDDHMALAYVLWEDSKTTQLHLAPIGYCSP